MAAPLEVRFPDHRIPACDHICLRNLHLSAIVGSDAWNRRKAQPVVVSVKLSVDTTETASTDDINKTVSYGQMCKDIIRAVEENAEGFPSILEFDSYLHELAQKKLWKGSALQISILLPKGLLRAEGGLCLTSCSTYLSDASTRSYKFDINGLKIPCIVGVNAHERLERQLVIVDLTLDYFYSQVHNLTKNIATVVENSSYETLEALAMAIVRRTFHEISIDEEFTYGDSVDVVKVAVEKPNALAFVDGARVEITRTLEEFEQERK